MVTIKKITQEGSVAMEATQIIDMLNHIQVDGETMEHIIRQVGMEDQMLRQLLLKADTETLVQLIMERRELRNA